MDPENAVFPKFYVKAVEDKAASEESGTPKYKDVEYVEIRIAGDKHTVINKKVNEEHKQRWPKLYEQFKADKEQRVDGTPLSEWSQLSASRIAELKALNIYTVEALSQVSDTNLQNLGMGGRDLVQKAKKWLEVAKDGAKVDQLIAENVKLKDELEYVKQQVREMGAKHDSAA